MALRISRQISRAGLLSLLLTGYAMSATMVPLGSGVEARFGSQSNGYTDSDPTGLTWTAPGMGTYSPGSPLPGLPAAPAPLQHPITWGNQFQNGGPGYTNNFVDSLGGTTQFAAATFNIADTMNPLPTMVQDAQINFNAIRLAQGPAAPGYAFVQLNFSADYGVTSNLTGLAGSTPTLGLTATGQVQAANMYAQFDATLNYSWTPVNSSLVPTGPTISLGSLTYQITQTAPGSFVLPVNSAGSLLAAPAGDGILEINGYAYLAGDPSTLSISVPEPTALGMFGIASVALLRRKRM